MDGVTGGWRCVITAPSVLFSLFNRSDSSPVVIIKPPDLIRIQLLPAELVLVSDYI